MELLQVKIMNAGKCFYKCSSGMVSLCAGCNVYEPWAALIVGTFGGLGFMVVHFAMLRLKLDDPLDAVAVHGGGGLVGILAVPWFMYVGLDSGDRGVFWDGSTAGPWLVLAYNSWWSGHSSLVSLDIWLHVLPWPAQGLC